MATPRITNGASRMETPQTPFLTVPQDPLLLLSSPPCSPLPSDWHDWKEAPPTVLTFDLDAAYGLVHLGDGQVVDLAEVQEKSTFKVVRMGAVISKVAARREGSVKRSKSTEENITRMMAPPPITVDCYE